VESWVAFASQKRCSLILESFSFLFLLRFINKLTYQGAGVLSGLIVETVARLEGDCFVLSTPTEAAHKVWISQGLVAARGVVVARLLAGDKDLGPHAFVIDMKLPGVRVENMAPKTAFNALDNAIVAFDSVRLPHSSLLGRHARIVDGRYDAPNGPVRFVQLAQRLLSGRLCIATASLSALDMVSADVRAYMAGRMVCTGPAQTQPLLALPYVVEALRRADDIAWVFRAYMHVCEADFAALIEGGQDVPASVVDAIAAAKCELVEFATTTGLRLRQLVGAYGLAAGSQFGIMDIFLCMRFAEGDTRVLQQKLARDLLRALRGPRIAALAASVATRTVASHAGLLDAPATMWLRRDQLLLSMAARMLPKPTLDTWLGLAGVPYAAARWHALATIHDTVAARFPGRQAAVFAQHYASQDLSHCL
jgi:acyl-CoA oxidase